VDKARPGTVVRARCGTGVRTRGAGWVEQRRRAPRDVVVRGAEARG
jgi:hypothetical protein